MLSLGLEAMVKPPKDVSFSMAICNELLFAEGFIKSSVYTSIYTRKTESKSEHKLSTKI